MANVSRSLFIALSILVSLTFLFICSLLREPPQPAETRAGQPEVAQNAIQIRQQWLESAAWKNRQAGQHLAVLVPYRDRADDLAEFLPIMTEHLTRLGLSYDIYIIEQQAEYRFNRGMLLNVGFLEATKGVLHDSKPATYVALHDIDMVPCPIKPLSTADRPTGDDDNEEEVLSSLMDYGWVAEARSLALCVEQFGWRQPYPSYLGGVLLINADAFRRAGGMPTRYWGWGAEDDDFAHRLSSAGVYVTRPAPYCLDALRNTRGKHTERIEDPNRMSRLGAGQRFAELDRLSTTRYKLRSATQPSPHVHHLLVELEAARWVQAAHLDNSPR